VPGPLVVGPLVVWVVLVVALVVGPVVLAPLDAPPAPPAVFPVVVPTVTGLGVPPPNEPVSRGSPSAHPNTRSGNASLMAHANLTPQPTERFNAGSCNIQFPSACGGLSNANACLSANPSEKTPFSAKANSSIRVCRSFHLEPCGHR
jgi:hypothetical protein